MHIKKKAEVRREFLDRRRCSRAESGEQASIAMRDVFIAWWCDFRKETASEIVAGYWPLGDEMDVRPLLEWMDSRGMMTALPVIDGKEKPLLFRQWRSNDPLETALFGTYQPLEKAPLVLPTVFLVPLVAFDRTGNRLGYGGGFYDRTLAQARRDRPVLAIGVAYSSQESPGLTVSDHDQRLDWIVTEQRMEIMVKEQQ